MEARSLACIADRASGQKTLLFLAQKLNFSWLWRHSQIGLWKAPPHPHYCNVSLHPLRVKTRKDCVTQFHND
jgi:hypothetical protein